MRLPDFTVEHLKQLPLRAIVGFAARCARRVEPLAQRPADDPDRERRGAAIDSALRMAEDFARGADAAPERSVVEAIDAITNDPVSPLVSRSAAAAGAAHAAATAWHAIGARDAERFVPPEGSTAESQGLLGAVEDVTVDLAALDAFTAAVEAYSAIGAENAEFVAAALNDYDQLLRLKLGRYPEPGGPIDPSPAGPLGRL